MTKTAPEVMFYNGASNGYRLSKDPRCLYGWGSPSCRCMFGHGCFREFGHPGRCWDGGETAPGDPPCHQRQRPKNWDTVGRAAANV